MTVVLDPSLGTPSGITLSSLVERVQQALQQRENLNVLASDLDEAADVIPFTYSLSGIARGTEATIGDETVYVWETDQAQKTATVRRGHGGTEAIEHTSGELVSIGGKSRRQIVDAINDELAVLSSIGLYQMKSALVSDYNYHDNAYALEELDGINDVYDVQALSHGQTVDWVHVPGWRYSPLDNSVSFGATMPWTTDVRVLYKAKFAPFTGNDDDLQSDIGLQAEAADILVYGACWRLLTPDEAQRNNIYAQGDTRRPSEVQSGAILRASLAYKGIRDERISEEKDRLRRKFPTRKSGF